MTNHILLLYIKFMMLGIKGLKPGLNMNAQYEIQISGELDRRWSEWFNGIEITVEYMDERTPLTTFHCPALDQAKLRGIVNKIWDLNLDLVSVRRLPDPFVTGRPREGYQNIEPGNHPDHGG
jgi:hypothetical protein